MPLHPTVSRERTGLCFLSLDAGGSRAVSQLNILSEMMHRLNFDAPENEKLRPCDVFQIIGGSGSGGFIAMLLVLLGLTDEQALEEFHELSLSILERSRVDAEGRMAALENFIDGLLDRHAVGKGARLLDRSDRSKGCKLIVPISHKCNLSPPLLLRNYDVDQKELNFTLAEAMMMTLASPPLFTTTSVINGTQILYYMSADLTLPNPTARIIAEAHEAFREEEMVACVLSLGCGHPGVLTTPEDSESLDWIQFLERLVKDGEQKAEDLEIQMGHLGLYHRFSVSRGLEIERSIWEPVASDTMAHVTVYLTQASVSRRLDSCIESLKLRDGVVTLEQLRYSQGPIITPSALPPVTRTFVMRKDPWDFIEKVMFEELELDGPRMLAVTGIGGCGKTQLILKFMRVHKGRFVSRLFIDGSSVARIRADTIRHVRSLSALHSQKGFEECLLFLSQPSPRGTRLLVYDNVDNPDLELAPLIPSGDSCAIVITSRNRLIGNLCPGSHLDLDVMSMDEAMTLLLYPVDRFTVSDEVRENTEAVAKALGCLPIALQQARSYMAETKCLANEYCRRLVTSRDKLLSRPVRFQLDMAAVSTYAAFETSFEKLDEYSQRFLRILGYFHWSKFPLELVALAAKFDFSECRLTYAEHSGDFEAGKVVLEEAFLRDGKWSETNLDEMIISLHKYSLITLVSGVDTMLVQLHPLTHGWIRWYDSKEETSKYQAGAILLLALGSRVEHTPSGQYLASHVTHMNSLWDHLHVNMAATFGDILQDAGLFQAALQLRKRVFRELRGQIEPGADRAAIKNSRLGLATTYWSLGRYKDAEALQLEALSTAKETLGEQHPDTIAACNNLALTYRDLGKLKEAETLQEKVLKLRKEALGDRHPDTITASNNLAITYHGLGRLQEVEVLQKDVLRLRKEVLGDRHPDTIMASNNLAVTYRDLGRVREAKVLQEEVLRLRKEVLREHHPDTVMASNNLALTYRDLDQLHEAKMLLEDVVKLRKEMLGERHPDSISASENLALTYRDMGKLKDAALIFEEVLRLNKEMLGDRHPDSIGASNHLALAYYDMGLLEKSERLLEDALRLSREVLGEQHPITISASLNLALTYRDQGRLNEAEVLQERLLELCNAVLGGRHPYTIAASTNMAITYRELGRMEEAKVLLQEVIQIRKEELGERHPESINACSYLGLTYHDMGQLEEAEALQGVVLKLCKEVFGEQHQDIILASKNLALTYRNMGRLKEAGLLQEEILKLQKELLGERHIDTITTSNNLADVYLHLGRLEEAEALQFETLKQARESLGNENPATALSMLTMVEVYESLERKSEALELLDAAETIIIEQTGKESYMYLESQKIRARVHALSDPVDHVTVPDSVAENVIPNPEATSPVTVAGRQKRRNWGLRLLARLYDRPP